MSVEGRHEGLRDALCEARDALEDILKEARTKLEELGASKFVDEGVGVLAGGIGTYANLFIRTGLEDRQALDAAVAKSNHAVREAGNWLHDVEDEWIEFLGDVEIGESQMGGRLISIGANVPTNVRLKKISLDGNEGNEVMSQDTQDIEVSCEAMSQDTQQVGVGCDERESVSQSVNQSVTQSVMSQSVRGNEDESQSVTSTVSQYASQAQKMKDRKEDSDNDGNDDEESPAKRVKVREDESKPANVSQDKKSQVVGFSVSKKKSQPSSISQDESQIVSSSVSPSFSLSTRVSEATTVGVSETTAGVSETTLGEVLANTGCPLTLLVFNRHFA